MKARRIRLLVSVALVLLCVASLVSGTVSSPVRDPFLGIAPQDEKYYKVSSDFIKCKDGSKKFSRAQLNDDFCDCPDGTDEPGTSACPQGKFYCRNVGHTPLIIFSSRVNDGICDCCDGSDEYDGQVKCPNTCWEAGKVARDKLKKKIATYQEGVVIREKEAEQAKLALAKEEAELSKLKSDEKILKKLVEQLKDRKEQIEKAEEEERVQKEKEKEKKEAEEKANQEKIKAEEGDKQGKVEAGEKDNSKDKFTEDSPDDKVENTEDDSSDEDMLAEFHHSTAESDQNDAFKGGESHADEAEKGTVEGNGNHQSQEREDPSVAVHNRADEASSDHVTKLENDRSVDAEALSREELGRRVASRWTGEYEKSTGEENAANSNHEDHRAHEEIQKDLHDEEDDGYAPETDDENQRYDDDDDDIENEIEEMKEGNHDDSSSYKSDIDDEPDFSDITTQTNPSWLEKIQQTVQNILQAVNLFQKPVDKSEAARVRKEYDESSVKLSKIQSRISSLTKKLKHDFGPEKEFYSFYDRCFESKQNKYLYKICPFKQATQEEGYTTTRLGEWDKYEDSYRFMIFSNGDRCWNGPDRSLKVRLKCGLKNELTDVDEPSRCEYVALFSTPALCRKEKLKELQDKLDSMNKEQPQSHDEL